MTRDLFKQLNSAQRQAVDTIDGPVMVIAGPGTGKTQLLALRAANILQKTDTAPQNILCLTYTEVGARNMRERLTQLIGQAAYDIRISTYHSFGSELIRQYSDYFQNQKNGRPIDTIGQIKCMQEVYETIPASNPLWRTDVYLKDMLQFISECKRGLLNPDDIRTIATANEQYIALASQKIQKIVPAFPRMNKDVAQHFIVLLEALATIQLDAQLPKGIIPLNNLLLIDLAAAIETFNNSAKTTELTAFKNKWLSKNHANEWVLDGQRTVNKLRGAADIYERYLAMLASKNMFDYDDMIHQAIQGLQENDDLRYSLHEQYLYIMLDEFQDTNRAQLQLVKLLSDNPVLEDRPNVLAVGDDDQAIYSFQGAELSNMITFSTMYKNVKVITLTENYRSHTDILYTAESVSNTIDERLSTQLGTCKKELIARNTSFPQSTVERRQFKSDISQYDWIAKQVAALIKKGTAPNEIAIVAPKHKYIEPIVPYLMALDIPIRYDKRENVLDDTHILSLTSMAQLVMALAAEDYSTADSLWPAVLSGDYWQLSTSTLWQISWDNYDANRHENGSSTWQRVMMAHAELKPIALFFAHLAHIQQHETLENMFDYLVGVQAVTINEPRQKQYTSPYYEYYFGDTAQQQNAVDFTQTVSNLTVLRQHLREYRQDSDTPLKLTDLLDFIADYRAASVQLLNTSPYHSAENAVQLMTVYGSKGLEFDVVFVVAAHDEVWGMKDRSPNNTIVLPPNLLHIRRAGTTKDERKRLLYVALSRAKHSLYITGYTQNYAGKTMQSLEFLNEVDGSALALPEHAHTIQHSDIDALPIEPLHHFWTSRHAIATQQASLKDLVLPRLESFQLSATHLNTFTDLVYGGPEKFFMNTVLRFPQAPTSDGQFGNAIHETLESMQYALKHDGELPDITQVIDTFSAKLRAKKLSSTEFNRLQGRGAQALEQFLPWWWHNFTPDAHAEYSFRHEGSFVGTAHLTGNLDQLLVDNESKTIRVIDFKTGKPHARWSNDVKAHKYRQQLLFYKLLVEHSHSFKGYEVDEAKLVFVEPDALTGTMHELPIQFTADDIAHTKQLIAAIWQRITNLDLPDTQAFSKDLKGIIAFEEWLIVNTA